MLPRVCLKNDFPLIISGYTKNSHLGSYYKRAIARLQKSLLKFDLPHIIFPMIDPKNWIDGCSFKPSLIYYMLDKINHPVLWIDADGEILQEPTLFNNPKFDLGLVKVGGGHWLSGTLYVGLGAKTLIDDWKSTVSAKEADEITLLHLVRNKYKKLKVEFLPQSYNSVVHSKTDASNIVIGHYIRPDVAPSRGVKSVEI